MRLVFRRAARKALNKIPADRRRQILSRIKDVVADPGGRGVSVRPLAGSDLSRLRVGDYRVVFSLNEAEGILMVELIRTRGDVYKR
jgi:mRNA interferase RelE/StbE